MSSVEEFVISLVWVGITSNQNVDWLNDHAIPCENKTPHQHVTSLSCSVQDLPSIINYKIPNLNDPQFHASGPWVLIQAMN